MKNYVQRKNGKFYVKNILEIDDANDWVYIIRGLKDYEELQKQYAEDYKTTILKIKEGDSFYKNQSLEKATKEYNETLSIIEHLQGLITSLDVKNEVKVKKISLIIEVENE